VKRAWFKRGGTWVTQLWDGSPEPSGPLRDHFRSPVNDTHSWDEVHGQWPGEIVRHLTTILPTGFRAAPKVHLGSPFEVDVRTYDLDPRAPDTNADSGDGVTRPLTALSPTLTVEADLSEQDEYEVRIYDVERGRQLGRRHRNH
jgi:hypothetical protein